MLPDAIAEPAEHPGNGAASAVDAHEMFYRQCIAVLMGRVEASSRMSRLDVRADRLEVIVNNQVIIMRALVFLMDRVLVMSGSGHEVQMHERPVESAPVVVAS